MTSAPARAQRRTHRIEQRPAWIAAALSALLHVALFLIALHAPPITVSTPQGSAAGGLQVVDVDYIGDTPPLPSPVPARERPAAARPAASRLQTTAVVRADDPVPPHAVPSTDAPTPARDPSPAAAANPPPPTPRRSPHWGQPPGLLRQTTAPVNAGDAQSPAIEPGHRYDMASAEPNLEVGGYQVVYDLRSETRLRTWRDAGMTELFLPLPGTRQLMVCPLETALRRGSGRCRLLEPDDPALADIGDAREVLTMHQVYRRGELVWRGPGAYR